MKGEKFFHRAFCPYSLYITGANLQCQEQADFPPVLTVSDLPASVKIFSQKISRSAAPCVAVAVDNAASIWRFCRIFRIIKLPECIRTVAYHSAPVIFHIFHCLVFFITHQKCFHKMMVHIRRNHSFFRFQFHQTIQDFCSFFAADCFRQNNPYLTCS